MPTRNSDASSTFISRASSDRVSSMYGMTGGFSQAPIFPRQSTRHSLKRTLSCSL